MQIIERIKCTFAALLVILLSSFSASAQLQPDAPGKFLGFELGTRFSLHHEVSDYAEYLGSFPGVSYVEYGETSEGRPLECLTFTHPELEASLEEFRLQHLNRMNGGTGLAKYDDVAIVWLSYNVHGNEAVCTEAALEVMHELAVRSGNGDEAMKKLVILLDPCLNPDGHDRYAVWFNQYASGEPNADPLSIEHDEPWPGGRSNHYWFDLNRDWAWQKQQESQFRSALYHQWMPHVHCDYHEMGYNSPYYFAPAAEPYHEAITDWQREFQEAIGNAAAAGFDARGELYYTRESFDLFYPSYGDTYPIYNGAIGMTYEQGGSGGAGVLVEKNDGQSLSLRERMDNHVETSLSAVAVSAQLSERLVQEFAAFHETNRTRPFGQFGGYLIPATSENASRVDALVEFLGRHQIECQRARSMSKPQSGWEYGPNQSRSILAKEGDLFISAYQTHSRLLDVLFDPNPVLTDSVTYDITTWSVPYAYGLQTFGLEKPIIADEWEKSLASPTWTESNYGYAVTPEQDIYMPTLAALHRNGIRVRTNSEAIVHANATFPRGTLFVLAGDQTSESWTSAVQSIQSTLNVNFMALSGGHAISGPDFGSDKVWLVDAPRVAMLTGAGVSSLGSGEVWWHFEKELSYAITRLNAESSNPENWSNYDVMIVPAGWYGFADDGWMDALRAWTSDGGRIVAIEGALRLFTGEGDWGLKRFDNSDQAQSANAQMSIEREENRDAPFSERERHYAKRIGSGSIYGIDLDVSHPLAWGYRDAPYYTLRSNSQRYAVLDGGWTVGRYGPNPQPTSGFVGSQANRDLAGSMTFGVQPIGAGHLVLLADNPLFRGFWENGKRLFDNAVFMPLD